MAAGVSKEIKDTIHITIDEVFQRMNSISWLERQKALKDEAFKNTEKILYSYNALVEHVKDEKEYIDMINKAKSKSIIRYSKNRSGVVDEDQLIYDRLSSYQRSKTDVEKIEKALKHVRKMRGFEVIELRYFNRKENGELNTFEDIAEIMAGQQGYGVTLSEKTVRRYRQSLVREIAIYLFGSDAI